MFKRALLPILLIPLFVLAGCEKNSKNDSWPGQDVDEEDCLDFVEVLLDNGELEKLLFNFDQEFRFGEDSDSTVSDDNFEEYPDWAWNGDAWVLNHSDVQVNSGQTASIDLAFWVQYRSASGNVVRNYIDADRMQVRLGLILTLSESESIYSTRVNWNMAYTGLLSTVVNLTGSGDFVIRFSEQGDRFSYNFRWRTGPGGIDKPANGCPDGLMIWDLPPYVLELDYNTPSGFVTWTLKLNNTVVDSDSETMTCGGQQFMSSLTSGDPSKSLIRQAGLFGGAVRQLREGWKRGASIPGRSTSEAHPADAR